MDQMNAAPSQGRVQGYPPPGELQEQLSTWLHATNEHIAQLTALLQAAEATRTAAQSALDSLMKKQGVDPSVDYAPADRPMRAG